MNKEIIKKNRRTWKWRNAVSFYLLFVTIVLLVSGVALYIAPPGRFAHTTDWRLLGFTKEQWDAIHTIPGYIGTIFGVWHLILNWKPILHYLRDRARQAYRLKAEFVAAFLFTIVVWAASALNLPPFDIVMAWGEGFTESWEQNAAAPDTLGGELEGEIDSSGQFTIEELCEQQGIPLADGLANLEAYGLMADSDTTIRSLADASIYAPSGVSNIILGLEPENHEELELEEINSLEESTTIEELCEEQGIPLADGLARLEAFGILVDPSTNIHMIADTSDYSTSDISNMILGLELEDHELEESTTIEELCEEQGVLLADGLARLEAYGLIADPSTDIHNLVDASDLTAMDITDIILGLEPGDHMQEESNTIAQLCEQYGIPLADGLARLEAYGLFPDPATSIRTLADSSSFTPSDLSNIILGLDNIKWGQFTVEKLCELQGIPLADGLERLEAYGLDADPAASIRTLADASIYSPSDVGKIIMGVEPEDH